MARSAPGYSDRVWRHRKCHSARSHPRWFAGGVVPRVSPGRVDPIDAEPITITNLNGFVGLAYISGMVTQTNTKTGEVLRLPFMNSDMRFMQGEFRGTDGRVHRGTFALV